MTAAGREALVGAARRLDATGLNVNASGNLSVRTIEGVLVTPSGISPEALTVDDCVLLDGAGEPVSSGGPVPTSERWLHVEVYRRRSDVSAIVHTHSPEATAAATLGTALPAIHYVVARFGGTDLACSTYATYGTTELAANVAATLGSDRTACLMANHGATCVGDDLDAAVSLALDVEWFCGVYRRAVALGAPAVLDEAEIARVAARFATYGQPDPDQDGL